MDAATITLLIETVDALQLSRYTSAAAVAIYLYNIFLTFDLEVEHIWKRLAFNLPITLYIINRYVCLVFFGIVMYNLAGFHGDLPDSWCRIPFDYIGFTLAYFGWTGIMTVRVCALWRQKVWLVRFINVLWVGVMASVITIGYLGNREILKTMAYNPAVRVCAPASIPPIVGVLPIPTAVYELFLTVMTIVKAIDYNAHRGESAVPMLYRVLVRDGVAYFVLSVLLTVVNLVSWYALPNTQLYLLLALYWALLSTFMARMTLNLKDANHQRVLEQQGGTAGASALSTDFAFRYPKRTVNQTKFAGMGERDFEVDTRDPPKVIVGAGDDVWDGRVLPVSGTQSVAMRTMELRGKHSSTGSYELTDSHAGHGRHGPGDNSMHYDGGHTSRLNTSSYA